MLAAKLLSLLIALPMSVSTVGGVDMGYEGEVDIYSGDPVEGEEYQEQQTISLADGGIYDRESHMFVYTVSGGTSTVTSSVADGMITTSAVSIDLSGAGDARLYLNGEEVDDALYSNITDIGMYSLVVSGNDVSNQLLSFSIVPEVTGMIDSYKLPLGFDLQEVAVDGEIKTIDDVSKVDMTEDGEYLITYRCNLTGIDYGLDVVIDHTPPTLTLEGLKDGRAGGPVTIKDPGEDDKYSITLNGEKLKYPSDGELTQPGDYVVTVTDTAGNTVTESFEIGFYLNSQGLWFGILFLLVIVTAIGYMIWSRKKLRVR